MFGIPSHEGNLSGARRWAMGAHLRTPGAYIGGILKIQLNPGPTDWKAAPRQVCLRVGEAKIGAVTTWVGGSK